MGISHDGLANYDGAAMMKLRKTIGKRKWNESCSQKPSAQHLPESMKRICVRAQRSFPGWWRTCHSNQLLGGLAEPIQAMAKQIIETVNPGQSSALRVLSLADGSMLNNCKVPTSVLLAHSFASLGISALPLGVKRVVIFGADSGNCRNKPQSKLPYLPKWIELRSLEVNNQEDLVSQFTTQCRMPPKFDAVVMRQGLCFCEDLSWEVIPPKEVQIVGLQAIAGCQCCGTFILEPHLLNGRPCYKRGKFLLFWRPSEGCCSMGCCSGGDWAVVGDHGVGDALAFVRDDVGNPSLAREPWHVWDAKKWEFKVHYAVSCILMRKAPWSRPPSARRCCAGIPLHAKDMLSFMNNIAMMLDEDTPRAFALLHGGLYAGTQPEVNELHAELEEAVRLFNSEHTSNGGILATTLKKSEAEKVHYWERFDGLLLSRKLQS
mmetsp:Transcript_14036/g.25277  ORF Transcript_14036/g.25277 Transcript_14036/m.25277 type:complete len:433 (+) Transcript_14036:46-1344(+)